MVQHERVIVVDPGQEEVHVHIDVPAAAGAGGATSGAGTCTHQYHAEVTVTDSFPGLAPDEAVVAEYSQPCCCCSALTWGVPAAGVWCVRPAGARRFK